MKHVLGLAAITHHEAATRHPAVRAKEKEIGEASLRKRVVNDLAIHLLTVELPQG